MDLYIQLIYTSNFTSINLSFSMNLYIQLIYTSNFTSINFGYS